MRRLLLLTLAVPIWLAESGIGWAAPPSVASNTGPSTAAQIAGLKAENAELKARVDALTAAFERTQARLDQVLPAALGPAGAAPAEVSATIPPDKAQVVGVAAAFPEPQPALGPHTIRFGGLRFTPGGFFEAADIERSRNMVSDIGTNWNLIPFAGPAAANTVQAAAHSSENRFTSRQSRLSGLIEGEAGRNLTLGLYIELDFQAAAQTANSTQSNSFNPRVREGYLTFDWQDQGLHFLAGQNWSLADLNGKGIEPRTEVVPGVIDALLVPGTNLVRQPQVRLAKAWRDDSLWTAISLENPATTTVGAVPPNTTTAAPGENGFDVANLVSINRYPDVIGKIAFDGRSLGRTFHLEGYGILTNQTDRHPAGSDANNRRTDSVWTGGFGAGLLAELVPRDLDLQIAGLRGRGVGRYSAADLPAATFHADGRLDPVPQTNWLAGLTWHVTRRLDAYGFAGREQQDATGVQTLAGVNYGLGNPGLDARACAFEVTSQAPVGALCSVQTRSIQQETAGFWWRGADGSYGRLQWGLQYSHTVRTSFAGLDNVAASGAEDIVMTSLRWYPF
ncbi:hypothetical protein [Phenylobacterium sp.]|uniref:hypothetical protein n=1 Tax=Phenylobacterium sp. TaxID=1871053 RepID=UPI00121B4E9C|nr:hypothetical protein [Phenylobacterium sp.]THD60588.1 MAG: hypothetical protein E8A49_14280 [Phenylobacterium sp.]